MYCTCAFFLCYTLLRLSCACLDPLLIDLDTFCFVYRSLAIPQFYILPPTNVMHNKERLVVVRLVSANNCRRGRFPALSRFGLLVKPVSKLSPQQEFYLKNPGKIFPHGKATPLSRFGLLVNPEAKLSPQQGFLRSKQVPRGSFVRIRLGESIFSHLKNAMNSSRRRNLA